MSEKFRVRVIYRKIRYLFGIYIGDSGMSPYIKSTKPGIEGLEVFGVFMKLIHMFKNWEQKQGYFHCSITLC
jgi:hypothetical protein